MMKKLIINCATGKQEMIDLTPEELADIPVRQAKAVEMNAEIEHSAKISAEMQKMAEESLIAKEEL